MPSQHSSARVRRLVWAAVCVAVLGLSASGRPGPAAAASIPAVGVVDFYLLSPSYSPTLLPGRYAADDLSAMLAQAGAGRITVIPRAQVELAEGSLGWQEADALHYARLSSLARLLGVDRLAVGWIRVLDVERGGGHEDPRMGGGAPTSATAILQVQVFDATQGRILSGTQSEATAMGLVDYVVAQAALHRALGPMVAPTLAGLTGAAVTR